MTEPTTAACGATRALITGATRPRPPLPPGMTENSVACPTCTGPGGFVSGACGTWVWCVGGCPRTRVISVAGRQARWSLVRAIRDRQEIQKMTLDEQNDYHDRLAILREHARHQWALTRAAFGLPVAGGAS